MTLSMLHGECSSVRITRSTHNSILLIDTNLGKVNAPRIYDIGFHLLDLWRIKSRIAAGHPYDVADDISEFSFDAILSAALGLGPEGGDIQHQHEELAKHASEGSAIPSKGVGGKLDTPVSFHAHSRSAKFAALRVDEDSLYKAFVVPWPSLYHRLNNLRPSVRAARRTMLD